MAAEPATGSKGKGPKARPPSSGGGATGAARRPCTEPGHPGGSWPSLNGDLRNARHQPAETRIGVDEAPALVPAWSFSGEEVGANGGMRSTPVVAGGCVYLGFGEGYLGARGDDATGSLVVTALQKSGVFHAVDATSLARKWDFFVGPGGPVSHAATAAVGADRLYVGATPNLVFELAREDGERGWVAATSADLFAYQPPTLANGVLYVINDLGQLLALDARNGATVLQRSIADDGRLPQCLGAGAGAGVAVARNTIFVPCDAGGPKDLAGVDVSAGGLVAYRAG